MFFKSDIGVTTSGYHIYNNKFIEGEKEEGREKIFMLNFIFHLSSIEGQFISTRFIHLLVYSKIFLSDDCASLWYQSANGARIFTQD